MNKLVAAICTLFFGSLSATSQTPGDYTDFRFKQLFLTGTFNSTIINDIEQDQDGLIWFGTSAGLIRYDGYETINYIDVLKDTTHFIGTQVLSVCSPRPGIVWFGTENSGLIRYESMADRFESIISQNGKKLSRVSFVECVNDSVIWFGDKELGLFSVKIDEDSAVEHHQNRKKILDVNNIFKTKQEQLYLGAKGRVLKVEKGVIKELELKDDSGNDFSEIEIISITHGYGQELWLATNHGSILVLNLETGLVNDQFQQNKLGANVTITKIFQDSFGTIWILTLDGLIIYNPESNKFVKYEEAAELRGGLIKRQSYSILEDMDNRVWIGNQAVAHIYDRIKSSYKHYYHSLNEASISNNVVRTVIEDSKGRLWVGTDDGIINRQNLASRYFEKFKILLPQIQKSIIPYSIYQANDFDYLIATTEGLLNYSDLTNKFSFNPDFERESLRGLARYILPINNSEILIILDNEVYYYHLETGKIKKYSTQNVPRITVLHKDKSGDIWVGATGYIGKLYLQADSIMFTKMDMFRASTLVLSINDYGQNKLAIGRTTGLFLFDLDDNRDIIKESVRIFTAEDGLPNDGVYSAIPDDYGRLWVGTNNGASLFDVASERFINFAVQDPGSRGTEFNRLAFYKTKSGNIILGGFDGIYYFYPSKIDSKVNFPKPFLIHLNLLAENGDKENSFSLLGLNELNLAYDKNSVSISFGSTEYYSLKNKEYYYRLSNYDTDWRYSKDNNKAVYINLPPGQYHFQLRTNDDPDNFELAELTIIIETPFWKAIWFKTLGTLLLVISFGILLQRRFKRERNFQLVLEKEVENRTRELEASQKRLTFLNEKKDMIFSILSHDMRAPLTTLVGFLRLFVEKYEMMKEVDIRAHAKTILASASGTLSFLDNTLYWSLSETSSITPEKTEIKLSEIFLHLTELLDLVAAKKNIAIKYSYDEDDIIFADQNMTFIALRNLISNAIKFSEKGEEVMVSAKSKEKYIEFSVIDRGIGISHQMLSKILDGSNTKVTKGTLSEKGTGLGLILCKNFVEANGGTFTATSKLNQGSEFTIRLPKYMGKSS